jgi:hypothetical protein
LLEPLPDLQREIEQALARADSQLAEHRWEAAANQLEGLYARLLQAQPVGDRFDKTEVLWHLAIAYLFGPFYSGSSARAALWALVEDTLTRAERSPESIREMDWPAVANYRAIVPLPDNALVSIRDFASGAVSAGVAPADPDVLLRDAAVADYYAIGAPGEPTPPRQPGRFTSDWSERVFIGGNYQAQWAPLHDIASEVRAHGWDPVLAWEFYAPAGQIHHHALMLLHECRSAVFDVTTPGGQLMELERTRDYMIDPLVVMQGTVDHGYLSPMVGELLARQRVTLMRYSSADELGGLVRDYLGAAAAEGLPPG